MSLVHIVNHLAVFAGPNGSGKTTTISNLIERGSVPSRYISPDITVLTPEFEHISDITERYIMAMKEDENRRMSLIDDGVSFTFETVMSHPSKLDFLRHAKDKVFFINLYFIGTTSSHINVKRVDKRVSEGGHSVPVDKIIDRWERSFKNLLGAIPIADKVTLLDNSGHETLLVGFKLSDVTFFANPNFIGTVCEPALMLMRPVN